MAYTGQQIADRVREQINDDYKRRVPDAEILNYINDTVKVVYDRRPDFLIGLFSALPADIALGGTFPLEDRLLPAVIDYCVAMSERPDDEAARSDLGTAALQKFERALQGDK